jgi:hypothetical protein
MTKETNIVNVMIIIIKAEKLGRSKAREERLHGGETTQTREK